MTSCRHCQKWEVDRGGLCELCRAIFGVLNLVGRPEFLPEDFKFALDIQTRLLGRLASNLGSPAVFAALGDQSFPQHPPSFGSGGERFQEKPQSRYRPAASLRNPSPSPDPRVGSVCASRDQDQKRRRREDSRDSERSVIPRRRRNSPLSWKPSLREPATKPLHLRPAKAPVVVPPRAIVHKEADYSTARQPPYHNSSKAPSRRPPSPPPKPTHPPQSKGSGGKSKGKARSPFQGKGQNIWAWTPSEPSWGWTKTKKPKKNRGLKRVEWWNAKKQTLAKSHTPPIPVPAAAASVSDTASDEASSPEEVSDTDPPAAPPDQDRAGLNSAPTAAKESGTADPTNNTPIEILEDRPATTQEEPRQSWADASEETRGSPPRNS